MKSQVKGHKSIDIRLDEEKFYFPGETIRGVVALHPKSPTKTNHIRMKFVGEVFLSLKDKESIQLFQKGITIPVASADSSKSRVLDAKPHRFAFEFVVPDDLHLPSSMELDRKKAWIRYTLTAIHGRPMVPESLCAKAEYTVPILEFLDITAPIYSTSQEKVTEIVLPKAKYSEQCQVRVSIPRFGVTRGDIVPVNVVINHYKEFHGKQALQVELVRIVEIRTAKSTVTKEQILRSVRHDLSIVGPYNFSHSKVSQLLIPTSTPPTIRYKDKMLRVHYKICVQVNLSAKKKPKPVELCIVELPIVIGTWPRADIPIDDDDELEDNMGNLMLGDDTDDDVSDKDNVADGSKTPELLMQRSSLNRTAAGCPPSISHGPVDRSSSIASRSSNMSGGSESSWFSSVSNEYASRITSISTNSSNSDQLSIHYPYARTGLSSGTPLSQNYLGRSSSTPDLLACSPNSVSSGSATAFKPPLPPRNKTEASLSNRTKRASYYDSSLQTNPVSHTGMPTHQHPTSFHAPIALKPLTDAPSQRYQHVRMKSEDMRFGIPTSTTQSTIEDDIPVHILQPIPSVSSSHSSTTFTRHHIAHDSGATRRPERSLYQNCHTSTDNMSESNNKTNTDKSVIVGSDLDSDDSDDEMDLLRVLAKKKKEQEKDLRQRQRVLCGISER
ncbi:ph-response sensor protein [Apophysomyces sp. BC1034]|nr:ph-response sensor protein [Apophysomyces sp. BC1015]KAG0176619.1 ph-response sensor protein [Apophysomyces sp. BC1021]KAG0186909.1 ph-response sensor protein [Apophysomyces sp. BC1034]